MPNLAQKNIIPKCLYWESMIKIVVINGSSIQTFEDDDTMGISDKVNSELNSYKTSLANINNHTKEAGFTLLEVLMALSVFALIAGVSYTALGPAGEGFRQLQQVRDQIESASWLGKQLRADVSAVTSSSLKTLIPIQISSDVRGDIHVDELTILVREAGRSGLTWVHYKLDEEKGELLRESRMAWARDGVESDTMVLGETSSFDVELMDNNGKWVQQWAKPSNRAAAFVWPKALRVRVTQNGAQQQWVMAFYQALK
ncbi:MAG: type II secretion system protein [Mariprofundaceae bacterium]|nr:type II secretion system protein [Mariprofundaceae bacterium]